MAEVVVGLGEAPPLAGALLEAAEVVLAAGGELLSLVAVVLVGPGVLDWLLAALAAGFADVEEALEDEWLLEPPHPATTITVRVNSAVLFIVPS